jgi:hypothetical protein
VAHVRQLLSWIPVSWLTGAGDVYNAALSAGSSPNMHCMLLLRSKPVNTFRRTWAGDWALRRCCRQNCLLLYRHVCKPWTHMWPSVDDTTCFVLGQHASKLCMCSTCASWMFICLQQPLSLLLLVFLIVGGLSRLPTPIIKRLLGSCLALDAFPTAARMSLTTSFLLCCNGKHVTRHIQGTLGNICVTADMSNITVRCMIKVCIS